MKMLLMICATILASIYCFSFGENTKYKTDGPTLVELKDTARSITLQVTQRGGFWKITSGDAASYLKTIAVNAFEKNVDNFVDITIEFDSLFTAGVLVGYGLNANGERAPIGAQFKNPYSPNGTSVVRMNLTEEHTCTGVPCACCKLKRLKAK